MSLPTPESSYDVIVIGAGIAGLIAAAYAARGGAKVCVLESNHQSGGLMAGIWRRGFYFDVGDQSFEQGNILFPLLMKLGIYDDFHFLRSWYRLKTPNIDTTIRTANDLPAAFAQAFPTQAAETYAFFGEMNRDIEHLRPLLREDLNPLLHPDLITLARVFYRGAVNTPRLLRILRTRGSTRAADFYGADSEAFDFFRRIGYRNMSLFVWMGFMYAWWHDYWYPIGGIQTLFTRLEQLITSLGGQIYYRRSVIRLLTTPTAQGRRLRVTGVETAKGDTIRADHVIYTGDMKALYQYLLPEHPSLDTIRPRILRGSLSEALTSVYLGVDVDPAQIRDCLQTHHTFYFPHYDIHDPHEIGGSDLHERAWVEISSPSLDPENAHLAPPGQSAIVLQTMVRAAWYGRWQTLGASDKRAYRALKHEVAWQMIHTLGHLVPGIEDRIVYMDVGSALSASRFTHNSAGATAGWTFDPLASPLRNRLLSIRTPVEGLLTAGHYAIWPAGVPMAALTGYLAALRVLDTPIGQFTHALERLLPLPAFPPEDDPGVTELPVDRYLESVKKA